KIVGAAKVLAVHSRMWRSEDPAGKGHPNESDNRQIEELVDTLNPRLKSDNVPVIDLDTLMYQSIERADKIRAKLDVPWVSTPKHVNIETCTQCGLCEEECPAAAVVLNPYPEFGPNCFDCYNCIRLCPENAIESAISISKIEEHIKKRVLTINERPPTQIFI
ncbi:MAG: 4Fe-4S binding protein, partial [Deltaproteobacteria bacterium]|nr:4Fe-4S binding protein [Deltaproteobacteria bacterium]